MNPTTTVVDRGDNLKQIPADSGGELLLPVRMIQIAKKRMRRRRRISPCRRRRSNFITRSRRSRMINYHLHKVKKFITLF